MIAITSILISVAILYFNKNYKLLSDFIALASGICAITIILLLTMTVVGASDVGVQKNPVWNPFPDFLLIFGSNQLNEDQRVFFLANILMTLPLASIVRTKFSLAASYGLMFALIMAIEMSQYLIANGRTFEISDIVCNLFGALIGISITNVVLKNKYFMTQTF